MLLSFVADGASASPFPVFCNILGMSSRAFLINASHFVCLIPLGSNSTSLIVTGIRETLQLHVHLQTVSQTFVDFFQIISPAIVFDEILPVVQIIGSGFTTSSSCQTTNNSKLIFNFISSHLVECQISSSSRISISNIPGTVQWIRRERLDDSRLLRSLILFERFTICCHAPFWTVRVHGWYAHTVVQRNNTRTQMRTHTQTHSTRTYTR